MDSVPVWPPVLAVRLLTVAVQKVASASLPDFINQVFPKRCRLLTKADFANMRSARGVNSGGLRIIYRSNGLGYSRLGLAVSRKYGNAVCRNRLKRQIRDLFRLSDCREMSMDLLAVPRGSSNNSTNVADDFQHALTLIRTGKKR